MKKRVTSANSDAKPATPSKETPNGNPDILGASGSFLDLSTISQDTVATLGERLEGDKESAA